MKERKNQRRTKSAKKWSPLIGILAAAAVLLVAGVTLWVASSSANGGGSQKGPRLAVSQERIDFGRVPLNKSVRAEFKLTNEGDRTLTLDTSTPIKVLEGC